MGNAEGRYPLPGLLRVMLVYRHGESHPDSAPTALQIRCKEAKFASATYAAVPRLTSHSTQIGIMVRKALVEL